MSERGFSRLSAQRGVARPCGLMANRSRRLGGCDSRVVLLRGRGRECTATLAALLGEWALLHA
eukprot:10187184-Alexandrium_andersonii.AAC.1